MKKILVFAFIALFSSNVFAISEEQAQNRSLFLGVGSGLLAGALSAAVTQGPATERLLGFLLGSGVAIFVGTIGGYMSYEYFMKQTPRVKFSKIKESFEESFEEEIIFKYFASLDDFFKYIGDKFGSNWPLVLARNYLINLEIELKVKIGLLEEISMEAFQGQSLTWLFKECEDLKNKALAVIDLIENRMILILENGDYKNQVQLYEKYMEEEKKKEYEKTIKEKDKNIQDKINQTIFWQKEQDGKQKTDILNKQDTTVSISASVA